MLERIYNWLKKKFEQQQFVFRYEYYDGTEENKEINDAQVFEYEFINQGNSLCIINDMKLYPPHANIQPDRIKLEVRNNEKDVAIYRYKFAPVDFQVCLVQSQTDICSEMVVGMNEKICGGNFCINNFPAQCLSADCFFQLIFFLDGVQVNTPIIISCQNSAEEIELLLMGAMTLEPFDKQMIDVVVTYIGNLLCFQFSGFIIEGAGLLTAQLSVDSGLCLAPVTPEVLLTCQLKSINQLLVISKVIASVRTSNP